MSAIRNEFEHYGRRRVQAALRQQGLVVNHKKVKRLMRERALEPGERRHFGWAFRAAATAASIFFGEPCETRDALATRGSRWVWLRRAQASAPDLRRRIADVLDDFATS
jgi:HTH-like domain